MALTNQNFKMVAGDTTALNVVLSDSSGDSMNLTGASARWQLALTNRGPALISKSIGAGITVTSALGGALTIVLEPEDTVDLSGRYYHELEIVDSTGNVSTVTTGFVTIAAALIN
jgi:hypothetical protein